MLATHPLLSLAAMRTRDRATALMLSLLLPLAAVALLVAFSVGTVVLAEQDRAIVWAQGTPAQLAEMQRKVLANPWFGNGRSALPSALYLRTRSLLACMLAHVQVSAWAFCLG